MAEILLSATRKGPNFAVDTMTRRELGYCP
jgi:hypothetical protein